ncbi:MAG TPA: porphobilinogen synthase [Candidatus Limnocylindria bacterium]|jgi:porphobilinogen synthase|nr:porphobilinogen synthase [Candidatus Limnocylindria bacterium]
MREATLARGRLAEHPVWSRVLAESDLAGRTILPVIVSSAVEDREKVEGASWLERLSLTEVVREARAAASAGLAGLLLFGISDRKDEHAILASQRDHVVPRAIRAVKEAVPELAVATDVCVCAYTAHGQCVLFGERGADVPGTLEHLAVIARVHADAGADLLVPSGMLDGTVGALRASLTASGRDDVPVAGVVKLESALYVTHRVAVGAVRIADRAVPLIPADDAIAAVARARRHMAEGADAIVIKPGAPGLDVVARLAAFADRPLVSYFTVDEHAPFVTAGEGALDPVAAEREHLAAARRAGASLVISSGAGSLSHE